MKCSPNTEREVYLCLKECLCSRDMSPGQRFKMREIGKLVANLLCIEWFDKLAFLIEETYFIFYVWTVVISQKNILLDFVNP